MNTASHSFTARSQRRIRLLVLVLAGLALGLGASGCASDNPDGVRISRPWYSTELTPTGAPTTESIS